MGCFKGTFTAFSSPEGDFDAFEHLEGALIVLCPIDVAGPNSLCLDDGTELWYDEAMPFDF